jgi:putative ABC transport system permease protein
MTATLWRASLRHLVHHPWQMGLSILGVALGVAVLLGIDLANESARRSFALFTQSVAGRASHQVVGGPMGLGEDVYRRLRVEARLRQAAPVVERDVAAPEHPGVVFHLLGVDPFAEAPFRPTVAVVSPASVRELATLLTRPGGALMARDTARRLGVRPGDSLVVRVGTARRTLTIVGELRPRDEVSARAFESLLVTDVATAQEVLGVPGRLTRIDLIVPEGAAGEAVLARVRAVLPPDADVVSAGGSALAVDQMTRAFRVNLTALSLLALVVGLFLIYNTMTFSIVQRRELIGMLRALGVTRREVFGLVLGEALVVGVAATALGLPLGVALGSGLVTLVTRTINDLYVTLTVSGLLVPAFPLVKAIALGVVGTLAAAVPPALEATGTAPRAVLSRSTLEARARRAAPRLATVGVAIMVAGWGCLSFGPRGLGTAYAALFAVLLGSALLTPLVTVALMKLLGPLLGWLLGLSGRMAAGAVVQALSRTSVALAALVIAVATTVGVAVMIHSFRETVERWLTTSLQADVYVSPPSLVSNRPDATLDAELVARLTATPGVAAVATLRTTRVQSRGDSLQLLALDTDARGYRSFTVRQGDPATVGRTLQDGQAVLVSEPLAYRRGLRVGDRLALLTDRGEREFTIAGVYDDYGSSEGVVLMSRRIYQRFWDDRAVSSLGLRAAEGVDVDALVAALRLRADAEHDLLIRSNRALREASLAVFDRTFAVTVVLRWVATLVAFIGVLSALTALVLERSRELAVLRAQGLTPREVWRLIVTQTGLMGLVAGLLALPVGLLLSLVLIRVVNQRSFGWTLQLAVGPGELAQALVLAVGAALLAGLYPAWRITHMSLPEALRGE